MERTNVYEFKNNKGEVLGYAESYEIDSNMLFKELYTSHNSNFLSGSKVIIKTSEINSAVKVAGKEDCFVINFRDISPHEAKLRRIMSSDVEFMPTRDTVLLKLMHAKEWELDEIISKLDNLEVGRNIVLTVNDL